MNRILFITTGLKTGGAEKMLAKILSHLHGRLATGVVSLTGRGPVSVEIEGLGVPVWHLGLELPRRVPVALPLLATLVRRFRPNVLQGWMYHGNLAALAARPFCIGSPRLVWGIRRSLYDLGREKRWTGWVIRLSARLSARADAIVYNSEIARARHEAFGFSPAKALVIDNGFDADLFTPNAEAYRDLRSELGLAADALLVGLIARYHPIKGHEMFLRAAAMLAERMPEVQFLLVGRDVTKTNPAFRHASEFPLAGRVHLLGERTDVPRLTAALDIASSSSWSEGFPNALGEAMICSVPCVSTDVGDVRRLIGDTGIVVPVGNAVALALAWEKLLSCPKESRTALGAAARQRVMENFALNKIAAEYERLYVGR